MKFLVSLLIISLASIDTVKSLYCYWNTGCPYKYFGSKTPYDAIRGDIRDTVLKLTDCEPVSVWTLVRHGKRHPGGAIADTMKEAVKIRDYVVSSYYNGNSSLCAQDIENLRDMKIDNKIFEQPYQLSDEGTQEMMGIGRRLKQAFPNLFSELDQQNYIFRPTFGNWMEDCAKSFVKGIANNNLVIDKARPDYDVMAPYATCGKYQRDIKTNSETYEEPRKYQESSEYLVAKDRIQRRLGIDNDLTKDNITALYNLCRLTWSSHNNSSPWCALFTTDDLQVMEYIEDVKNYYKNGYGNSINGLLGQIPMADLLLKFQEARNGNGNKVVAYFTHATMMDMVYTSLKLFKDDKSLVGTSPRNLDRKWRSSKCSPFAANLIVVLNKCRKDGKTEFNVVFYLNEEPLMSVCKEGVCTWQEFEDKLKPFLNVNTEFCEFKTVPYK